MYSDDSTVQPNLKHTSELAYTNSINFQAQEVEMSDLNAHGSATNYSTSGTTNDSKMPLINNQTNIGPPIAVDSLVPSQGVVADEVNKYVQAQYKYLYKKKKNA